MDVLKGLVLWWGAMGI